MFKKSLVLILVLCLTITLALSGCAKETAENNGEDAQVADQISGEEPKDSTDVQKQESDTTIPNPAKTRDSNDTLIIGESGGFNGQFVSAYSNSAYDTNIVRICFSPLLRYNADGVIEKVLAKDYEVSEDKKTFTFHLRDDVVYSDGTKLTAKDVAFTYNLLADPSYDGPNPDVVQDMVGYEEYSKDTEGKIKSMSGIEIVNDYTIKFTFKEAIRTNIERFIFTYIMPEHFYGFEKGKTEDVKAKQHEVLGSGPYKLVKYEPGQFIELVVNEKYFGEKKPQIPRIVYKVTEHATEVEELISGEVDMLAGEIDPDRLEMVKESGFVDFYQYPRSGYGYMRFNTQEGVTKDKAVRQAIIYGFNRKGFVETFFKGLAVTQDVPLTQVSWAYTKELREKLTDYTYNPEKSNQLLDEAGWKMGDDGIRYKDGEKLSVHWITIADIDMYEQIAGLFAENMKAIGVDLQISMMDFNSLMDKVYNEREGFNLYSMAVSYYSPDPDGPYSSWHSKYDVPGGGNAARFHNDLNDELLDKGRVEFDTEKAKAIYEDWAVNINEEIPIIIVYANLYTDMMNNRIKGYNPSAIFNWSHDVVNLSIEK